MLKCYSLGDAGHFGIVFIPPSNVEGSKLELVGLVCDTDRTTRIIGDDTGLNKNYGDTPGTGT